MKTGPSHEAQRVALEDRRAGDVDRQQIGRALHARRLEAEGLGDSSGQQRLAGAGYVLQQHVPVGKEGQGRQPQWLLCADYCLRNRVACSSSQKRAEPSLVAGATGDSVAALAGLVIDIGGVCIGEARSG